jgi:phosphoglycolate phosphatase
MKLVLFDCDGTLVDSASLIHEVMARSFVAFGHKRPELALTKSIIGLSLDIAIARMLGTPHVDDEAVALTAHYKSIYADVRGEAGMDTPLFDGIKPLVDALVANREIILGAVTGKSRRGLTQILDMHGLSSEFIVSRTADDCPSKPHPAMVTECCEETGVAPHDTIVVGDAIFDMQMAKSAGATAIGVAWGYAAVEDLLANGADAIAHHPNDLLSHIV